MHWNNYVAELIHISMPSTWIFIIYLFAAQEQVYYEYFGISGQSSKWLF